MLEIELSSKYIVTYVMFTCVLHKETIPCFSQTVYGIFYLIIPSLYMFGYALEVKDMLEIKICKKTYAI